MIFGGYWNANQATLRIVLALWCVLGLLVVLVLVVVVLVLVVVVLVVVVLVVVLLFCLPF